MSEREFEVYLRMITQMLKLSQTQRESISNELRDHMEARLEELCEQGIERSQAIQLALAEFGDVNTLVRDFLEIRGLKARRRIMRTTVGTLAACAAVTFSVMILTPTNRQGLSVQQTAIAQGSESPRAAEELDRLRAENEKLRQKLSMLTGIQMKDLGPAFYAYSDSVGNDKKTPVKPSDLKDFTDFQSFLAPYDPAYDASMVLDDGVDVWEWVDNNSSFVIRDGVCGDPDSVLLEQREAFIPGHKWALFGDGHAELLPLKPVAE